jgi:hypothetical protein
MSTGLTTLPDEVVVHRIGGGAVANLTLTPAELALDPPGISVLWGGSPADAALAMRRQFPRKAPSGRTVVGSTTVGRIRAAGFDVIMNATRRFPQHARLIHPQGAAGFTDANLRRLASEFQDQSGL